MSTSEHFKKTNRVAWSKTNAGLHIMNFWLRNIGTDHDINLLFFWRASGVGRYTGTVELWAK